MKIKSHDEAIWFDYPGAPDVKFRIRKINPIEFKKIQKEISELKDSGVKGLDVAVKTAFFGFKIFSFILVDWQGIEVESDKPLDPSSPTFRENFLLTIYENDQLRNFVIETSVTLNADKTLKDKNMN